MFITSFFIVKFYYEKCSSRTQSDFYYIKLIFFIFFKLVHRNGFFVGEEKSTNDDKINLLNTFKQTLENKLEKCLTLNGEISNIIEEVADYESDSDIAMEAEPEIRESLENLRTFLSTNQSQQPITCNEQMKPVGSLIR